MSEVAPRPTETITEQSFDVMKRASNYRRMIVRRSSANVGSAAMSYRVDMICFLSVSRCRCSSYSQAGVSFNDHLKDEPSALASSEDKLNIS